MYLGKFQLNGYLFEAYERIGNNGGKEFRLVSSLALALRKKRHLFGT
jgi:hypothetical protein